jgi:lipoprotein NlpD
VNRLRSRSFHAGLGLVILLAGCAAQPPAPIVDPAQVPKEVPAKVAPAAPPVATATVKRGDTLYAIAFVRGLDFRDVAQWNGIREPYTIYPGQVLRLGPAVEDARAASAAAADEPVASTARVAVVDRVPAPESAVKDNRPVFVPLEGQGEPAVERSDDRVPAPSTASRPSPVPVPPPGTDGTRPVEKPGTKSGDAVSQAAPVAVATGSGSWRWPTDGQLLETFGAGGRKGLVIGGRSGQTIRAARAGEVVYAGGGLLGYGLLVIVKHDDTYLTAYGNNSRLLVKEGARIEAGQGIAEMGASADGRVGLHFELRRKGQPVDPLTLVKAP